MKKKFNLDGPDGYRHYWRDLHRDPYVFLRRNFGGGSLMVWGGFGISGKLELAFPSCRMNSQEYQGVLESYLLLLLSGPRPRTHVLQQDIAAVHVSNSTRKWLQRNGIKVIDWPACSPDCNPTEILWGIMVRRIYTNSGQYNSVRDLKEAVVVAWEEIDRN